MDTFIIDGKRLARQREEQLGRDVKQFVSKFYRKPRLVAVELSDNPGSVLYLKLKRAAAERVGIEFEVVKREAKRSDLPALEGQTLPDADGIFIQHPPGYDKKQWQKLVDQIPPEQDVDCLTSTNLELIKRGAQRFLPATVKAIGYCLAEVFRLASSRAQSRDLATARSVIDIATLDSSTLRLARNDKLLQDFIEEKHVVILGRSPMVGLPLYHWLRYLGGDVTLLHSQSTISNQQLAIKDADILISTTGKPGIITGDMVKEGVVVIDSGSPSGDVVFGEVALKASVITPVPGGVGPLTVVSLMENVVESAYHANREGS